MSSRKKGQGGRRRDVSDVEMIRTGDSKTFGTKQPDVEPADADLAQPKGRQTRAAIANHLANKLKIDPNTRPEDVLQQYTALVLESKPGGSQWENIISTARNDIAIEKQKRREMITSEKFLNSNKDMVDNIKSLLEENEEVRKQSKKEAQASGRVDISTEESVNESAAQTEESIYVPTATLATSLNVIKDKRKADNAKKKVDRYKNLISILKHRTWRQSWDFLIILIAIYSVMVIPIRISVSITLFDPAYDYIDLITWLIYVTDVFINLRTTYVDNYGLEVVNPKLVMKKYVASLRFVIDILSLFNLPSLFTKGLNTNLQVVLNILGLLKLSRFLRAQTLIVESRMQKDAKAQFSCCFYFVLLLIYLHMIGCLFFFFCLQTYEVSSTRLGIIDDLGLRLPQVDGSMDYQFSWVEEISKVAETEIINKGEGATLDAWVPAYDNYDGSERFWRHYELSRLTTEEKEKLFAEGYLEEKERDREDWAYVWSVAIYYSVLVIGGNEMQPAQVGELAFVVFMNILGLIFMTYIAGEIAVLVAQISIKSGGFQQEIDQMNTAMKNAHLPKDLQLEIRNYFLKVQGTMAQQDELTAFFQQISMPLRIAVQQELFTKLLLRKNKTIKDTMNEIVSQSNQTERKTNINDRIGSLKKSESENLTSIVNERIDNLLPILVERLDTSLLLPHHGVIFQGQGGENGDNSLYYVGKGDCKVNVRDNTGKEHFVRRLDEGDHFGEVSIIYNCTRTANVISMNYNTFAVMTQPLYRRLIQDYPEYENCLKKHVVDTYRDSRVQFLIDTVKRVEYLSETPIDILYELIFTLKSVSYDKEQTIFSMNSVIDSIYFIEEGTVEVSTEFEGNLFILDTLQPGTVINYRAVFLRDHMYVDMRALTDCKILQITLEQLMDLVNRFSTYTGHDKTEAEKKLWVRDFSTRVSLAYNRYLKAERAFPLDYLAKNPSSGAIPTFDDIDQIYRKNLLKNVAMRIVNETRERKKRPKLEEVMAIYRAKKHEPGAKELFQEKFIKLYGDKDSGDEEDDKDDKYKTLIETLTRVKQQLGGQQVALSGLVMRVNNLIEKKNRREAERAQKKILDTAGQSRFSKLSKQSKGVSFNGTRASHINRDNRNSKLKAKDLENLAHDSDEDVHHLHAERQKKDMDELFQLDQKYLLKEEEEEDDIYSREARRQKEGSHNTPFMPLRSPFIDRPESGHKSQGSATGSRNDTSRGSATQLGADESTDGLRGDELLGINAPVVDQNLHNELEEWERRNE